MLKIGGKVPNLSGATNGGKTVSLSGFKGKFVVVYFYPKDNTTGCTREAQDFRDAAAKFARRNAVVIGVSRDSVKSHDGFVAKHKLPFDLVADSDETWCRAFDVIHEKVLYGRRYLGVVQHVPDRTGWPPAARMAQRQGAWPRRGGARSDCSRGRMILTLTPCLLPHAKRAVLPPASSYMVTIA